MLQFVVYAGASAALFMTDVGRQALVDQWERTAIAFGQAVDAARYAELQELSASGPVYGVAMAAVNGPVASFVLAAVLFGVFTGLGRTPARFSQVLSVVAHASVILTLRHLVATPLNYARESITSPATLVGLVSMVDETSPVARFLALIDVFVVWWLIVLAVGLAVLYQRRTSRVAAGLVGAYVVIALALAGAMAALGGASGP